MSEPRRIAPQPMTLTIVPVELAERDEEALAAANGVDLLARRMRAIAAVVAPVLALLVIVRCILV